MSATPPAQLVKRRPTMRQAVRERILKEILDSVVLSKAGEGKSNNASAALFGRFVMVLDSRSTRVLSSALLSHDLGEKGVALVENLSKTRQPFPQLEAIYVLEPTSENLSQIEKDFYYWDTPLYSRAHVFLTRKPSTLQDEHAVKGLKDALRGVKLKRKGGVSDSAQRRSRLITLKEANIDFLAVEDTAFHLDLPKSLVQLFGPSDEEAVWCESRIVDGVVSLCATLNEYPLIRYAQGNALCENLAKSLYSSMNRLLAEDTSFTWHGKDSGVQGVVLFLDRRQDLAAPLLHEFTYQALVYDLLETRDNLVRYAERKRADESEEEYEQRRSTTKRKKALLNESDPLWVQFRHTHIAVVLENLARITRELRETTVGKYQEQGAAADLEQMGQVVKEMQIFKEVMAKHVMHQAICQSLMDSVNERALIEQARTEQIVVTGVDGEGERASEAKIMNDLSALMRRNEPSPNDKLRLACLHAVVLGQASRDVVQRFVKDANLPMEEENALSGLGSLGISLVGAATATGSSWLRKKTKPLFGRELETPYRNPESIERASKQAKATTVKVSRFAPLLKHSVESICFNKMTMESFPFVINPPPNMGLGGAPIDLDGDFRGGGGGAAHRVTTVDRSLSVRKHSSQIQKNPAPSESSSSASTAAADDKLESSLSPPQDKIVYQGGRIIVFVAGGASYSELRAISEVMRSTKREIIIGSTHFTKPEEFLRDLRLLGDDDEARRYLAEDVLSSQGADEFFMDEEEKKMLNDVLIDGRMDPAEFKRAEDEEAQQAIEEVAKNADLGIIPWAMGLIPFCGPALRAWFNGDDVKIDAEEEEEDDGLQGDVKKCFATLCPCLIKSKEVIDKVPLLQTAPPPRGQVV